MRGFLALLALAPSCALAATYQVTPANLAAFEATGFKQLACGDLVEFAGQFSAVSFNQVHPANCPVLTSPDQVAPSTTVVFDFSAATITGYRSAIYNSDHILVRGGSWGTPGAATVENVLILTADKELGVIGGQWFDGTDLGFANNSVLLVKDNTFTHTGQYADAVDIASTAYVKFWNNTCRMIYAGGSGNHPDCFQAWNLAGDQPVHDIDIQYNTAVGHTQGYDDFGLASPGAYNITVAHNVIASSGWAIQWSWIVAPPAGAVPSAGSSMTDNAAFTILEPGDENTNACPVMQMTDSTDDIPAHSADANALVATSGNNQCIPANISATLASAAYQYAQITALGADATAQHKIALAAPGTPAAQAAAAQAAADLASAKAYQAKIAATATGATTNATWAAGVLNQINSLSTDAAKQAAATP